MATTHTPTAEDICREAFQRVAGRPPDAGELLRAANFWFEEVLAEIWNTQIISDIVRYKHLENTATMVLRGGQRRYPWPEDFHRAIDVTLYDQDWESQVGTPVDIGSGANDLADYGYLTPGAEDGGSYLMEKYNATTASKVGSGVPYTGLAGRKIAIVETFDDTAGAWVQSPATGLIREILHSVAFLGDGTLYVHTLDDLWQAPEVPVAGDKFIFLRDPSYWVDMDMTDEMDANPLSISTGLSMRFTPFDNTLEFDVAPNTAAHSSSTAAERTYRVAIMRYWVNLLKVNKDSEVMKKILTDWRMHLTKGVMSVAAQALDDSRYAEMRKDFLSCISTLAAHDYDYGPTFAGFRSAR